MFVKSCLDRVMHLAIIRYTYAMTSTDTIALTTPAQISMWVLLSRRSQLKMHIRGMKTRGLIAACKREFGPHCTTARKAQVAVEEAIVAAGGGPDESIVNFHLLAQGLKGVWMDQGVFDTIAQANAFVSENYPNASNPDNFSLNVTDKAVRAANRDIYTLA